MGHCFLKEKGKAFLAAPSSFELIKERDFVDDLGDDIVVSQKGGSVLDDTLFGMLKDLRKKIAKDKGVPPFVVFQDPSLEDMTVQ